MHPLKVHSVTLLVIALLIGFIVTVTFWPMTTSVGGVIVAVFGVYWMLYKTVESFIKDYWI